MRYPSEKAGVQVNIVSARTVIPAKAGIHRQYEAWIPAFAGMTTGFETNFMQTQDFSGITGKNVGISQSANPNILVPINMAMFGFTLNLR
ncbi:hypothetical protein [Dyella nitratireducens]|uniref:Uncharacterized protein n=1 Tax=Dyella nitratireducens TaxID=1849580 RepID=A0ABQ1GVE4_9GAMM|nr:hypothetical protein [Dyella nitratireducens]GGA50889.1 hypothetical protein GCM10010981_45390 [Dyella nitratireducens]